MDDNVQPSAMAHAHHQFHCAALAGNVQNLIDRRQQRGVAFERKPLVAEIALLQRLFEQVGAHQQIQRALLVDCGWLGFDAFLNPAPPLRVGDVHELHADAAAIDAARLTRPFVVDFEVRMRLGRQQAERI